MLIVEHKSRGKSLDSAFDQAADYFLALASYDRPRYIITSDFANFRLYDLKEKQQFQCSISELSKNAQWFSFLIEKDPALIVEESPIDRHAAYAVAKLHEQLLRINFRGRNLEIFLTRLLFCFFADDTAIFGKNGMFYHLIAHLSKDGFDTGPVLTVLFEVLNTPESERYTNLDETLASFAFINGNLFQERCPIPSFDCEMHLQLLACAQLDWSGISPAIFGAMFQGVLDEHKPYQTRQATRRELGAHYTSERNILRIINPLFLDELRCELKIAGKNKSKLQVLYHKLSSLQFLVWNTRSVR